jgi:L-rhamnose-H+ transport protein
MSTSVGMSFAVISGACDGSFGVMLKVPTKWHWENIWIVYSIIALALFPVILAIWSVPDLLAVYRAVSAGVVLRTFLFGVGWGVGSVCFGLALYMLGQSIAYTVMTGLIAVGGSLIPMLVTNPACAATAGGMVIILSMMVTVVGVAFCGWAGKLRDDGLRHDPQPGKRYRSFALAFLVCLVGGVFSCMYNLAFHFAQPIAEAAANQLGQQSTAFLANNPIWALVMLGGFMPNVLYCSYLLVYRGTWREYRQPGTGHYWLCGMAMGVIFAADVAFYGVGASTLGKLGTTVGWLVLMAVGILIANFWGIVTGEWNGAPHEARRHMLWGSMILFISIVLANYGNYILP